MKYTEMMPRRLSAVFAVVVILVGLRFWYSGTAESAAPARLSETSQIEKMSKKGVKPVVYPKVILYGDSITQRSFSNEGRWGALLSDHLNRRCDVLNRGFSGYNSRWNLIMLPRFFSAEDANNIAAVVLFLGANDSNDPGALQHVPLDEYIANMKKMIQELVSLGIFKNKIIMVGTPPVDKQKWTEERAKVGQVATKDNVLAGVYADAGEKVAADMGVKFIDLYHSMMKEEGWQQFLSEDGVHLSSDGAEFLYERLEKKIDPLVRFIREKMPNFLQMDRTNLEREFLEWPNVHKKRSAKQTRKKKMDQQKL